MGGKSCWKYHNGAEDFSNLMVKFCSEFAEGQVCFTKEKKSQEFNQ